MMRKLFFSFFALSGFVLAAQTSTDIGIWIDHLPYANGIGLHQEGELVYGATPQGIFIYNTRERDIQRFSKVSGLTDVGLSAVAWSEKYSLLVIGYENGNIDLLQGESVKNYPDIRQSGNYPGLKRINHITIVDDLVYFSTDFGIVTFDLRLRYVVETFIIGPEGSTLKVLQTALTSDSIYAATDEGLYVASLNSALLFFENWNRDATLGNDVNMVTVLNNRAYVNDFSAPAQDSVFYREAGTWKHFDAVEPSKNGYLKGERGLLHVCNAFAGRAYDQDGNLRYNVTGSAVGVDDFVPAGAQVSDNNPDVFFVMSNANGLYQNFQQLYNENISPNSPRTKSVLSMHHDGNQLYVAPGTINGVWSPLFNNDGFFVLKDFTWSNKRAVLEQEDYKDIVAVISDPANPKHYFVSSYGQGVVEYVNDQPVKLYNDSTTNGVMESISAKNTHRVGGFSYDSNGNLWFSNSLTEKPICRIAADGTISSYSLGSVLGTGTATKNILYTSENQVWMQTRNDGIAVASFSEDGQLLGSKRLTSSEGSGNLPNQSVRCFAEDLDGEIWIGTDEGVGVIYSPINIFEPNANYDASTPQIPQVDNPGFGDPLLGAELVNDIEVDGSNKKWFATANSGVFYTSEDGTEQLYNFTKENSPLLSNNVLDIEVDGETGIVFFGTDQGIVAFQGVATEGGLVNEDVFAYPNPVEPGYSGPILIRGLVTNAQVKIADVEGNIVFETVAEGGQALWSGKRFSGERVASGVYIAYITDDLGQVTATTKILVVN